MIFKKRIVNFIIFYSTLILEFFLFSVCLAGNLGKNIEIDNAIVPLKNEILYDNILGEKQNLPSNVKEKINSVIDCYLKGGLGEYEKEKYETENIYEYSYVLKMNSGKLLYVTRLNINCYGPGEADGVYFIIAYDPQNDSISPNNIVFSGGFAPENLGGAPLLLDPIVRIEKSQFGDEEKIICKEIDHNGTSNQVISNYFILDKNLSFRRIFTTDEQVLDSFGQGSVWLETLRFVRPNEIWIDVYDPSNELNKDFSFGGNNAAVVNDYNEKLKAIMSLILRNEVSLDFKNEHLIFSYYYVRNNKEATFKVKKSFLKNKKYEEFFDAKNDFGIMGTGDSQLLLDCVSMP